MKAPQAVEESDALGQIEQQHRAGRVGEAVRLDPSDFGTHYNLGNALAQQRRYREAAVCFRHAISLSPYFVSAHKNLSQVLYRLGEFAEAVAACEQALRSGPPSAELYRNLGTAQRGAGELRAATESFLQALRLRPGWAKGLQSLTNVLMEQAEFGAAREACDAWLRERPADTEALGLKSIALAELVAAGKSASDQSRDRFELAQLMDVDGLVKVLQITQPPPEFASVAEFNAALSEQALNHSTLCVPSPNDPTYHGENLRITGEFIADPPLARPRSRSDRDPSASLRRLVMGALDAYMRQISRTHGDHPFVLNAPSRVRLTGWAAVLQSGGSLLPHVHYRSHVSAVYYAKVPPEIRADDANRAGWFEFGSIPTRYAGSHPENVRAQEPREGMLIVFPSYFYHATLPFTAAEPRISIAFDVVGLSSGEAELPRLL